jgi:hypothetical protein
MDQRGWRKVQMEGKRPDATAPARSAPFQVLRNRIERGERQFTNIFQRSAACCQDLAERGEASAAAANRMTESGAAPSSSQGKSPGYIPSQQRMGVPSVDLPRSFPPSRHSFTGGPVDPKQRADLYEEVGWLAREIQVVEGPGGFPPSEALDRLLDRVTGEKSGELDIEFVLGELKKHCRASGVHRLEIGESDLAARFEELALRLEALEARHFGEFRAAEKPLETFDTKDLSNRTKEAEQGARGRSRSAWLDAKMQITELTSDNDVARLCELAYNTIRDYRRGVVTTRLRYIQSRLAKGFDCQISEVVELENLPE